VLTTIDGPALEGLCRIYSVALTLIREAKLEPTVEGENGPKANPALREASKYWALWRQFAAEFGITPASRARIGSGGGAQLPNPDDDPLAEFRIGGQRITGKA
jgi:P27 family predicted phage terminase small subunit